MLSKSQWRWDNCSAKTVICWWPIFGDINALLTVVEEEVTCPGHVMCVTQSLPKEATAKEKKDTGVTLFTSDLGSAIYWTSALITGERQVPQVCVHTLCWQLQHLKSFGCEHCSTKVPFVCVCVCVRVSACVHEWVGHWTRGCERVSLDLSSQCSHDSIVSWSVSDHTVSIARCVCGKEHSGEDHQVGSEPLELCKSERRSLCWTVSGWKVASLANQHWDYFALTIAIKGLHRIKYSSQGGCILFSVKPQMEILASTFAQRLYYLYKLINMICMCFGGWVFFSRVCVHCLGCMGNWYFLQQH